MKMNSLTTQTPNGKRVKYLSREGFTISNMADPIDTSFFIVSHKKTGKFHAIHTSMPDIVKLHPPKGLANGDKVTFKRAGKKVKGIVNGISIGLDSAAVVVENLKDWKNQPTTNVSIDKIEPGW